MNDLQRAFDEGFEAVKAYLDHEIDVMRGHIKSAQSQMAEAISSEVRKAVAALPKPEDGKSVSVDDVRPVLEGLVKDAVSTLPKPEDGKSVSIDDVRPVLEGLVKDAVSTLPKPEDGKSVSIDDVRPVLDGLVKDAVSVLPKPEDGKSVSIDDVRPVLDGLVKDAVSALPKPEDGKSVSINDVRPVLDGLVKEAISALPKPEDGKSVSIDDVRPVLDGLVKDAVSVLPKPEDGKSVSIDDVRPVLDGLVKDAVSALPKPEGGRDGLGVADALVDQKGDLIFTFTNGTTKTAGHVVGPAGFNLDDFDATLQADGRTVELSFVRGDMREVYELGFPVSIWRGIFKDGDSYERGDEVTCGGSTWHCHAERTTEKPGDGSTDWQLKVKKGRDGKDFRGLNDRGPVKVKL